MKFGDIIGHDEVKKHLISLAESGRIPHAILLHGPSGIGKMKLARAFAQYINCHNHKGNDSCGVCPNCIQTASLNNPDIHYIYPILKKKSDHPVSSDYAPEWRTMIEENPYMSLEKWFEILDAGNAQPIIYVSESDEIIRISSLSTYGSRYKIFIVWLPEKMNLDTSNKLLKILEEPYEDTLFVFVSNNPGAIIPTINSRLQHIRVDSLPEQEIINYIESRGKSHEEAVGLAKIAQGNMIKASELSDYGGEMEEFSANFMDLMRNCYARKLPELRAQAEKFASFGREKSLRFLQYIGRMLRESFISNLKISSLSAMTPVENSFTQKFGPFINASNIQQIAGAVDNASEDILHNGNQKIIWFDLLLIITQHIRK